MKKNRPSLTSLLIARGVLLAEATPRLRPLIPEGAADLTRRLLAAAPSRWFETIQGWAVLRTMALGVERLVLPGVLIHWLVRKRWLDGLTREALASGCRQVVILGAGLDTLAWRLPAAARVFEIDHPATQETKRQALVEGPVSLLPADLGHTSAAALLRALPAYDATALTLFVAEGVLMYLAPERVSLLLRELAEFSAPGSRLACTFMEARAGQPIGFEQRRWLFHWWLRWRGEPFRWALGRDAAAAFLAEHGWNLCSLSSPEEFRHRYLSPVGLEKARLASGETVALAELSAR